MAILEVLSDPILPVYAIMAVGFVMGRTGFVSVDDARTLNRIALSLFMPLLLFHLLADAPVRDFEAAPILAYFAVECVVFAAGFLLASRVFRIEAKEAVLLSFGSIFANTVLIILPISILLYGRENILPITAIVTLDSSITFACAIVALQLIGIGRVTPLAVVRTVGRSPLLWAIGLGLAVNLAELTIPGPIDTFIDFNGSGAPPLALFSLGVVLSRTPIRVDLPVLTFTAVKFAVFPALVYLAVLAVAPTTPGAPLYAFGAAAPAGTMAFALAFLYGAPTDRVAQVIVITNVLTLFSLALLA